MQKAVFAITIPHFFLPKSAYISEADHESSIQLITPRSKVHGTIRITPSNLLIFNIQRTSNYIRKDSFTTEDGLCEYLGSQHTGYY